MAYQNQSGDRLKEITDKLEKGLQDLFSSGQYADYLKTMSKFYNYSASNTLLIYMQRPDASRVAGYGDWQKNFKRHVKRGEHGIKILAPCPYKQKVEREQTGPDGRAVTVTEEVTRAAFKPVTVFDVSQTEGEPLPSLGVNELTGDVEHYPDFFEALKQVSPFPVGFEAIPGGAKGYCNYAEQRIAINEGMAEVQNVKTAIHEITHATLHNYYAEKEKEVPPEQRKDQRTREVEAESVAYTVCQHYGIETSDYSFGYIAGWSSDKQTKELKASLATIRETAAGLIDSIDGAYQEIVKGKEQVQVQAAPVQEAPGQGEPDADPDTFNIYQLKGGDALHYHHFTGLDQLKKEGLKVEFENYEKVYSGPWTRGDKLEGIYERFNIDRPEDFTGHSLSVSDVVVLHRGGKDTSYYVDSTGFTELAQFIRPPFDVERAAAYVQKISGNVQDADERKTMGAAAFRANVKRLKKLYGEIPPDRPQLRLLVNCAAASPDLAALKERTAVLTEAVNHLKTAELSMEQNYNMIDGIINNLPPDATMNDRANALIDFVEKDGQRLGDGERRLIVYYAEQVQDTGKLAALVDELAGTGYEQEHGQLNYLVKSRVEAEAAAADAQHQKDGPLPPEHDPAVQPVVTVIWSENAALHNGQKMPLAEADALFKQLDAVPRATGRRAGPVKSRPCMTRWRRPRKPLPSRASPARKRPPPRTGRKGAKHYGEIFKRGYSGRAGRHYAAEHRILSRPIPERPADHHRGRRKPGQGRQDPAVGIGPGWDVLRNGKRPAYPGECGVRQIPRLCRGRPAGRRQGPVLRREDHRRGGRQDHRRPVPAGLSGTAGPPVRRGPARRLCHLHRQGRGGPPFPLQGVPGKRTAHKAALRAVPLLRL